MTHSLKESLKEFLRLVAISVTANVLVAAQSGVVDFRLIGLSATITGLRFVDKLLHEWGKETDNETLIKGLTRF